MDNKILRNIAVWTFIFLIFLVSIRSDNVVLSACIGVLFFLGPVYIHNLRVLPLFLSNRIYLGVFWFIVNISFFTCVGLYFLSEAFDGFQWRMVYNLVGILILVLFISSALKLASDSVIRRQHEKDAELKLLKAQLNPHFLFNTLNNLYGLSVAKSDNLPSLMLKLSDLLRYSLYDTKDKFVSLEKEVTYLENYMSLENIRLEDKASITFSKQGSIASKVIAPMLLIVFVENAFKHLSSSDDGSGKVAVDLSTTDSSLVFSCINSTDEKPKTLPMEKGKSGIGLKNVRKRLALLYPERHRLTIIQNDSSYEVKLTLFI